MKTRLILLAAILGLSGCATVPQEDAKVLTRLGVSYAVMKVVNNNPDRAPRIVAIAHGVRLVAGGDKYDTVTALMDYTRTLIQWEKLDAADTMLVNILLDEVKAALIRKVGAGPLAGDKLLVVGEVAGWIEDAAKASMPVKPTT